MFATRNGSVRHPAFRSPPGTNTPAFRCPTSFNKPHTACTRARCFASTGMLIQKVHVNSA